MQSKLKSPLSRVGQGWLAGRFFSWGSGWVYSRVGPFQPEGPSPRVVDRVRAGQHLAIRCLGRDTFVFPVTLVLLVLALGNPVSVVPT